jgi:hypothetical protein
MNLSGLATVGVRLVALLCVAVGVVLSLSTVLTAWLFTLPVAGFTRSGEHLHDTYYVTAEFHYSAMAPGLIGLVVGVLLFAAARPLARLLTRGVAAQDDE